MIFDLVGAAGAGAAGVGAAGVGAAGVGAAGVGAAGVGYRKRMYIISLAQGSRVSSRISSLSHSTPLHSLDYLSSHLNCKYALRILQRARCSPDMAHGASIRDGGGMHTRGAPQRDVGRD